MLNPGAPYMKLPLEKHLKCKIILLIEESNT